MSIDVAPRNVTRDEQYELFMRLPLTNAQRAEVIKELLEEQAAARAHVVTLADEEDEHKDEEEPVDVTGGHST